MLFIKNILSSLIIIHPHMLLHTRITLLQTLNFEHLTLSLTYPILTSSTHQHQTGTIFKHHICQDVWGDLVLHLLTSIWYHHKPDTIKYDHIFNFQVSLFVQMSYCKCTFIIQLYGQNVHHTPVILSKFHSVSLRFRLFRGTYIRIERK